MKQKKTQGWVDDPSSLLRVGPGFRLDSINPSSTPGFVGTKSLGEQVLKTDAKELGDFQELLFANSKSGDQRSVLLILQAMDTAGKGGILRHVVGQVDPQGVQIAAFKAPTEEERQHDFLWRVEPRLPKPGMLGVFDRSHYEDVLIQKVRSFASAEEIERRYGAINEFEKRVHDSGTVIVKVMLHISFAEQAVRLEERLDRPEKHWKYNPGDIDERELWPAYQDAYQTVFERSSTEAAPWFVVPANRKWYARLAVQQLLLNALEGLNQEWPKATFDIQHEKQRLQAESKNPAA